MKTAVMGASGQLGRKVVDALLQQGASPNNVIAAVRTPEKVKDLADGGVTVRRAEYEDPPSMKEAFRELDALLLIPSTAAVEPRIQQHFNAVDNGEFETVTDHIQRLSGTPPEDAAAYLKRAHAGN